MSTCYRQYNGSSVTVVPGFAPCSNYKSTTGYSTCCGGGSLCLEDGFCYNASPGAGQSGYYMAICTDPSYKDASCPTHCVDLYKGDVVYNPNTNLWSCCGQTNNNDSSSAVSCTDPTSETFQDLSPQALQSASTSTSSFSTSSSASTSTSTSSSSTSTTTSSSSTPIVSSPPSASSSPPSNPTNHGLSAGASAGIGVGVALGALALLGVILFFFMRSRRARRNTLQAGPDAGHSAGGGGNATIEKQAVVPGAPEMDGKDIRHEMDGNRDAKYSWSAQGNPAPVQELGDENKS